MEERHTAVNTADSLKQIARVWKITDKAAIASCGYDDLLSVQPSYNKCILTFLSRENAVAIVQHGLEVNGITLPLHLVSEPQIEIKIFDAPIWVPDEDILSKISAFGTQIGHVRHGFVRTQAGAKFPPA